MCEAKISGPTEMFLGETVSLSATAYPEDGGAYSWNGPAGLTAGLPSNTAVFTPAAPGEAQITVDYTAPDGTTCTSAIHRIKVKEECKVAISGLPAVVLGESISLQGEATPAGGYFTWGQTPGLIPWASSAIFAGETAGTSTVLLKYTTADGEECTADAHNIDVYKVSAISGPNCANSGDRVPKEDYTISTTPGGYEDKVTVSPEVLTILLGQTADVAVTGSVAPNVTVDDATTTVLVANKNANNAIDISVTIPNYVNDALNIIGVGEATDLKLESSFSTFKECCTGTVINGSADGSTSIGLHVEGGPFTIIGVPLPPILKRWVTLDALAVTLTGSGSGSINGNYDGCVDDTSWSGSGSLSAGVKVAGEVKIKDPQEIFVLKGAVGGSTGVSEKISVSSSSSELVLSGHWDGLSAKGEIKIIIGKVSSYSRNIEKQILNGKTIPQITVALPSLQ